MKYVSILYIVYVMSYIYIYTRTQVNLYVNKVVFYPLRNFAVHRSVHI